MQRLEVRVVDCFNCLKLLGERRRMLEVAPGMYHCDYCKQNKQLDGHIGFHPVVAVAISNLAFALPVLQVLTPLLEYLPSTLTIGGGLFLYMGFILGGLRALRWKSV